MFKSLLIANRGEIAVRIIRAAKELKIHTIAIYSPKDKNALHVKLADEAFPLLEEGGNLGYLDMDQLMEICTTKEVDCIHPGYGFLSESEEFARRIINAGITFIGPSPSVIELLGNKVKSREMAEKVGLPVPPGSEIIRDIAEGQRAADVIGFPVIVKAVYGGGGMGIQIAENSEKLEKAIKNASAQAEAAFGRGEVFIEKFIYEPRHIEFQLIADTHGNVVHLGERECSIQRRNQKLLEEAPSIAITSEERDKIGSLVCQLAREVGYINAGTVEFLYQDGSVQFNEVNPRIQVEHPVTEMLTGKDLVKEQIKVAAGEKLSFKQSDIDFRGHAIELRITAEDPLRNFQPTPGKIRKFNSPGGPQVRFDTAIYEGFEVPATYDSLLGKLIIGAETREAAINRARNALKELVILGFPTNIPFFEVLLHDEYFMKGKTNIHFIQERKLLESVRKNISLQAIALFAAGMKKNKISLPTVSKQWKSQGRMEGVRRE
ncbi:MAG: acetyl-CoA carboxylase biotin carboxylase subunit [Candidatus Heimdallarchaeota archaeon]|nr:acetyl-CoA carboxylase biotin carboxylase subunit [Candidatus Heimdallarchaeota archaeon]